MPLLHVIGSLDPLTPNHTLPIESLYQQLGGRISVMIKDGTGHHPHSLRDPEPIADFIVRSLDPAREVPSFVGKGFTRTAFYSTENTYREFPAEGTFVTCRGPLFSGSFDRYEFKPDSTTGTIAIIAPKVAAPGKPWVFRADFVPRDAAVDPALLQRGYHIVTGPRSRDPAITVQQEWDAVYKHLVSQGFSPKPALEGAGLAAREAYAWAIANPSQVSCIYGENPVLRSGKEKTELLDNLAPLAKAGVPLLHVCGSQDPWLASQTRVAEKRYRELGGRITVMVKDGEGHYLSANHIERAVAFINEAVAAGRRQ